MLLKGNHSPTGSRSRRHYHVIFAQGWAEDERHSKGNLMPLVSALEISTTYSMRRMNSVFTVSDLVASSFLDFFNFFACFLVAIRFLLF